jgi:hypothetical protein
MPEKLQEKLTQQQMADLFAFIAQTGPPRREVSGNRPETVMASADGSLHLPAATCEIYAPGVTLGGEHLVWFYRGPNDHVVWTVNVPQSGSYEVWIEWAQIDEYADNPIAVEVEGSSTSVTGTLPSTGGWGRYQTRKLGVLQLHSGRQRVRLRPNGPARKELSDLRSIRLVPLGAGKL